MEDYECAFYLHFIFYLINYMFKMFKHNTHIYYMKLFKNCVQLFKMFVTFKNEIITYY